MARTSRNGAPNANSVQALDNLDLDDMFAEGNDDLFGELDGLGMDLGSMDEFAGANNVEAQDASKKKSQPAAPEPAAFEETPKRRKTKRKTSAPAFFDDDDEEFVEEPNKKKKRVTKATTTKRRASTKKSAPQPDVKTLPSQKKGKSKSTMPPPSAKPISLTSSAAAARRKSGGSGALLPSIKSSPVAPQKVQPSLPVHAGLKQSSFCGITPSRISFYPFLPALPQEVAMKNRKVFSLLDKIHSKFLSELTSKNSANGNGLQSMPPTHIIAKLMQEAYKEDKNAGKDGAPIPSKDDVIASAVGTSRSVVDNLNKGILAQDLLAVCALLKRQYDFLKQNSVNMEHWCRDNFSADSFAEVYTPGERGAVSGEGSQPAALKILSTFKVSTIRVKIICTGYKEPKTKLMAVLPLEEMAAQGKASKAGTKRKTQPDEDKSATVAPVLSHQAQYAQMRPAKRRKSVADLVCKVAYSLETKHQRRIQERKQAIAARDKLARDTATDQSFQVIHTVGMWKWLEQMGYCDDTADEDAIRVRLEDARSLDWGPMLHEGISVQTATIPGKPQSSGERHIAHANARPVAYVNNLLDLLVDEGDKEEGESDSEDEDEDDINYLGSPDFGARRSADLSTLSDEERTYLHLRSVGFLTEAEVRPGSALSSNKFPLSNAARSRPSPKRPSGASATDGQGSDILDDQEDETIDSLLEDMQSDLLETTKRNHRRSTYLEAVAQATLETPKEFRHRKQFESALNARHVAIIKRTKEARVKGGKNKATKNDDLALPW